jgi:hypothetical protein
MPRDPRIAKNELYDQFVHLKPKGMKIEFTLKAWGNTIHFLLRCFLGKLQLLGGLCIMTNEGQLRKGST